MSRFASFSAASILLRLCIAVTALAPAVRAAGFANIDRPVAGQLLSGLNAPTQGRTAIIAFHNGVLYTVPELPDSYGAYDAQVRSWDLADPANPIEIEQLGITRQPINAHGYFFDGPRLILGDNIPASPWTFEPTATYGLNNRTLWADQPPEGVGDRGQVTFPHYAGPTWWTYDVITGNAVLARDGVQLASWDHLGLTGVIGHPFILGNLLIYASDQSRTGVAVYDISDPTQPALLDVFNTGGPGGYWPELWGGDGKLYVVWPYRTGGQGMRVVDITDPTDLRFVTDLPLSGDEPMYAQFQDEFAFIANHKIDMRTFSVVLSLDSANAAHTVLDNPNANPARTGIDTSQFALPLGNLVVTGGVGQNQGMAVWVHDTAADTRGPEVGYHIPRAGQTNYPLSAPISLLIHETIETSTLVNGTTFLVRPLALDGTPGAPVTGRIVYSFDDILTFTPDAPLATATTYEVRLVAGGLTDAAGNATTGYAFTFSTGANVAGNLPPQISAATSASLIAPGGSVTLTADAVDPDAQPGDPALEYRFDAGDGRPKTDWSTTAAADFTYANAAHIRATVQVRDPAGAIATAAVNLTVFTPAAGPRPTTSAPLAIDTTGRTWTVNPDNSTVTVLATDPADGIELEIPVADDPRAITLDATGNVWITAHDADIVEVRSPLDGALIDSIATGYGSAPHGIALDPTGQQAYVALSGSGRILRIDTSTRAITADLPLGPTPRAVAVSGDGTRVLVTRFISPANYGEVWDIAAPSPAAPLTLTRTLRLPKFGGDAHRDGSADGRGTPNQLAGLAITPDNTAVWVAATKPNTERGTLFAAPLDADNTVRTVLVRVSLATGLVDHALDVDNSDSVSAVAFSPRGDHLFATLQGNNDVVVFDAIALDANTGLGGLLTRLPTGLAPQGLAFDPVSGRLLVKNFLGRSITTFDPAPLFDSGEINLPAATHATVSVEALPANVLNGKRIFYNAGDPRMSAEGYISCATCHLDGGSDGRTWDFTQRGEGLRRTTDLRGRAGLGHGRVHWSANFDEIQDFELDIRNAFGGLGFLPEGETPNPSLGAPNANRSAELDDLAAYVASLGQASLPRSPARAADGSLTAAALAGRAVFTALNCNTCHTTPGYTDSAAPGLSVLLHDVGTLRDTSGQRLGQPLTGIDTPTLYGVFAQNAYLHDGSAATLADVFLIARGTTTEAETGAILNGYAPSTAGGNVAINYDNTVRGSLAELDHNGTLTFTNLDGGGGGLGAISFRYSTASAGSIVRVNGVDYPAATTATGNVPSYRHTAWQTHRLDNIPLLAGPNNIVEIRPAAGPIGIDHITVSTPEDLVAAAPHRVAQSLSTTERENLFTFIRSLDVNPVALPDPASPVATITLAPNQGTTPSGPVVIYDIVFSSPIHGLTADTFIVGGTSSPALRGLEVIVPGQHYRLRLAGFTGYGSLNVQLPEGVLNDITDTYTNLGSSAEAVTYDPETVDDIAPLSDEFDDSATLANWQRNNTTEGWNADKLEQWDINTTTAGRMRLMPYASSWYQDFTGAYAYKEVTGDFVVTYNLDVTRRNGQPGRPTSDYSLAGMMIRAPRGITQAAPQPDPGPGTMLAWPPPAEGQPGHYTTEWAPGTENYIFLSYGFGNADVNPATDVWQYEVKTTTNGVSILYPRSHGVPANTPNITLRVIRRSSTFLLLRRHGAGPWIIENRFERTDLPATLQVGITTYTDWDTVSAGWNFVEAQRPFHQNRIVNVGTGNPDLVADVDYVRLRRPSSAITQAALQAVLFTGPEGPVAYLAGTPLETLINAENYDGPLVTDGESHGAWLARMFTPSELVDAATSADAADADGDGLPNLLDYLVDGDAWGGNANHAPAVIMADNGAGTQVARLQVARNPSARGYRLIIEGSTDLVTWTTLATSENGSSATGVGLIDEAAGANPIITAEHPDASTNAKVFYRVRGELLP